MEYIRVYENKIGSIKIDLIKAKDDIKTFTNDEFIKLQIKKALSSKKIEEMSRGKRSIIVTSRSYLIIDNNLIEESAFIKNLVNKNLDEYYKGYQVPRLSIEEKKRISNNVNKALYFRSEKIKQKKIQLLKKLSVLSLTPILAVSFLKGYLNKETKKIEFLSDLRSSTIISEDVEKYNEQVVEKDEEMFYLEDDTTNIYGEEFASNSDFLGNENKNQNLEKNLDSFDEFDFKYIELDEYTKSVITNFVDSDYGDILKEECNNLKINYELMVSIGLKESSLNHDEHSQGWFRNLAAGMFQIEKCDDSEIIAYLEDGRTVSIKLTSDNMSDFRGNSRAACILMHNYLKAFNGNLILALDAYNKGEGVPNIILEKLAEAESCNVEDLIDNLPFEKYQEEVNQLCSDPVSYVSGLPEKVVSSNPNTAKYLGTWKHGTYGDPNYTKTVCGQNEAIFCLLSEKTVRS